MKSVTRRATIDDAAGVCRALRRSIVECCVADHHNDAAILDRWLSNKTETTVRSWIGSPDKWVVVAEDGGVIVGAAMLDLGGTVELCYLVPEARSRGIGQAMLLALELEARTRGLPVLKLVSTKTAHGFYRRNDYVDTGDEVDCFGISAPRMRKVIANPGAGTC